MGKKKGKGRKEERRSKRVKEAKKKEEKETKRKREQKVIILRRVPSYVFFPGRGGGQNADAC